MNCFKVRGCFRMTNKWSIKPNFLKDRNDASQSACRKQRNLCVTLLRKAKRQYFSNLEPKLITDNKKFWKSVKPLFSDK